MNLIARVLFLVLAACVSATAAPQLTLVAVVCANEKDGSCVHEAVTDSDLTPQLNAQTCKSFDAMISAMMACRGQVQSVSGVIHVVAEYLIDQSDLLRRISVHADRNVVVGQWGAPRNYDLTWGKLLVVDLQDNALWPERFPAQALHHAKPTKPLRNCLPAPSRRC